MKPQIPKILNIVNGPGRWDMMLAVFNGQAVTFTVLEQEGSFLNQLPIQVNGGYFSRPGQTGQDSHIFSSLIMVPLGSGKSSRINVACRFNLQTRRGKIENPAWVSATHSRATFEDLALPSETVKETESDRDREFMMGL